MKNIEKTIYELLEIQRGTGDVKEYNTNAALFLLLGYCDSKKISDRINLERIINSPHMDAATKDILKALGEEVRELKDVVSYLGNLDLPSDMIGKMVVTLKSNFSTAEQYKIGFEYMIEQVADFTGKSGAEETTSSCINELAVQIIEPKEGEFYDGVLGAGGGAIAAHKFAKNLGNELKIYGQEINTKTYVLAKIRMFMNEIDCANIEIGDMLANPAFTESKNTLKKFDNIIMCPPFSVRWKNIEKEMLNDQYGRFVYGTPSISNADWLFISSALKSLKANGKAAIITTLGALFRGGAEKSLRSKILGFDYIESIIELPSGLFTSTSIPSAMIIFNMNKDQTMKNKVQFIDAGEIYDQVRRGKRILNDQNIDLIVNAYREKIDVEELCSIVDLNDIEDANLLPSRNVIKTHFESSNYRRVKVFSNKLETTKTLDDVGDFYRGINVTSKNIQDPKGNYKIINLADINNGELDIDSMPSYSIENNARVEAYKVEPGDIIISSRGTTKIAVIPEHDGKILISQNFIGIRPKDGNNPEYIKEFLESPLGEYLIERRKNGTAVEIINLKDLKELAIVDVNGDEQNKIINGYKEQEKALKRQMEKLQAEIDSLKLDLYGKMGIRDIFEIL